jgi:hypothetical protein
MSVKSGNRQVCGEWVYIFLQTKNRMFFCREMGFGSGKNTKMKNCNI